MHTERLCVTLRVSAGSTRAHHTNVTHKHTAEYRACATWIRVRAPTERPDTLYGYLYHLHKYSNAELAYWHASAACCAMSTTRKPPAQQYATASVYAQSGRVSRDVAVADGNDHHDDKKRRPLRRIRDDDASAL